MLGWLDNVMTCHPDIAHAYSCLEQHQANPSQSALEGLQHSFRYRSGSTYWGFSGPMRKPAGDRDVSEPIPNLNIAGAKVPNQHGC